MASCCSRCSPAISILFCKYYSWGKRGRVLNFSAETMRGAVLVALAATVGNFLQGWDNSTIAGSLLYIKKEFNLQSQPTLEGLIVSMGLIGATIITTFSGPVSDILGRRRMLIMSSVFYFYGGLLMLWSPSVSVLILARLLNGFGVGLAVTLIPVYISETAPSEIRGQLNTLPQLMGSAGMFMSYCMVFGVSLMESPSWRIMLGVLSIPSLSFLALVILVLPESPRWLVSKGKIVEAKRVLQRLRDTEDVSGELALLVEGLGVGNEKTIEKYIIGPVNDQIDGETNTTDQVRVFGLEEGQSWIAQPVTGHGSLGTASFGESLAGQSIPFVDPLVTLFESVHENLPDLESKPCLSFLNTDLTSSKLSTGENHYKNEEWCAEDQQDGCDYDLEDPTVDYDDDLHSPLLYRESSKDKVVDPSFSLTNGNWEGNPRIGGGWQVAYKWIEKVGKDRKKEESLQRMYLHQEGTIGSTQASIVSLQGNEITAGGEFVQAAALVSEPVICGQVAKGPIWHDLFEPGVKRALIVGIALQVLQQASGINGVLFYTPQILEQSGVVVLLSHIGLNSASASFFISLLATFLMLPCIMISMRLMDVSGRRSLLLYTIPILILALLALVLGSVINLASILKATIATGSIVIFLSCFVMAFGVIPNILCAEIFPTRVRGLSITICSLSFWVSSIIVTYTLPAMLSLIGLSGLFTIFAVGCAVSWIFVQLKVPETKGMPLEIISEFFAMGATTLAKNT